MIGMFGMPAPRSSGPGTYTRYISHGLLVHDSSTVVRLVRPDRHAVVVGISYWIYWSNQLVLFW